MAQIVDACVYHNAAAASEILEYLPAGWRSYLSGGLNSLNPAGGAFSVFPPRPYHRPHGEWASDAVTADGATPGSDPVATSAFLDDQGVDRAVLCHQLALPVPGAVNAQLALELTRACNRLTWDRWLSRDPRLSAAALVASQMPVEAAAEVTALGEDPRCAAIVLMANGLGKPFGHPAYRPIIDAAADAGLPILLHVGGDTSLDVVTHGASAGRPATFTDHYALLSQSVTTHVVSLIGQGVFERHPDLKVFVVGAGVAWLTPVIWRFETNFKAMRRMTPGLTLTPLEYVMRNVRVSTYPLDEAADPSLLQRYLAAQEGMEDLIVYASGYPARDHDTRADVAAAFGSDWQQRIFAGNATGVFRWTNPPADRVLAPQGEQI